MIEWYRNLYMDDEVKKSPDACRNEAESGKIHIMPLYCVSTVICLISFRVMNCILNIIKCILCMWSVWHHHISRL